MTEDSPKANDQNGLAPGNEFDPFNDRLVEHLKLGVWDVYVLRVRLSQYLPTSWKIEEYAQILEDMPYFWRTLRDIGNVAWPLLLLYLVVTLAKSLIPVLGLWCVSLFSSFLKADAANSFPRFSGQILGIVSTYLLSSLIPIHEPFPLVYRCKPPLTIVPLMSIFYSG